jgi:hypothetical protein
MANKRKLTKILDRTGQRYGRLLVLGPSERKFVTYKCGKRSYEWLCRCDCGKELVILGNHLQQGKFRSCGCLQIEARYRTGEQAHRWKGGIKEGKGYRMIYMPNHHRAWKTGYVFEHLLVMENILNRELENDEIVHHKNGIRLDNRPENLELWTRAHPFGQRVDDLTEFAVKHLQKYAPGKLANYEM